MGRPSDPFPVILLLIARDDGHRLDPRRVPASDAPPPWSLRRVDGGPNERLTRPDRAPRSGAFAFEPDAA